MEYKNEYDKDGVDIADGKRAEANFSRLFKQRFGVDPIKSQKEYDKHNHIDFFMLVNGHQASVDVKSWKGEKDFVWVELVSYGKLGWLYGDADYIAFENPDEKGFTMVKRENLMYLIKCTCVPEFTTDVRDSAYRMYVRQKGVTGNFDVVTKIARNLLENTKPWTLGEKYEMADNSDNADCVSAS